MNRRDFIASSTELATAPHLFAAPAEKPLRAGLIGCGWYGKCDLLRLMQVANTEVVSLCDVDKKMLAAAAETVAARAKTDKKPRTYADYKEMLTRLRYDARLYKPVPTVPIRGPGRPRKWGERLPAPQDHGRWGARWQSGTVYLYGRERTFRFKERSCRWSVTGAAEPVRVFVFEVEGYAEPWFLVTTSATLTPAEVVAVFAARFRQEDGFRDHKQRLGMEECRAWTKAPVERTFVVQMVALTLLRLLSRRLDASPEVGRWWRAPDWNRKKSHPSVLDVRRAVSARRTEFSHFLRELDGPQESPHEPRNPRTLLA